MATVSRGTTAERFKFIEAHGKKYGVQLLCKHLHVSRSGYYAWIKRGEPKRRIEDRKLLKRISRIFEKSRGTYGSPRIFQALTQEGVRIGKKRVERLMREAGLVARIARVYRSKLKMHLFYNSIINKRLDLPKPDGPNRHWVADLTYLRQQKRRMYLAVVLDLYSRKVVGWSMGCKKSVELTSTALLMAIKKRSPSPGLIFHTDRGVEYRAYEMQQIHKRYGIIPSMNRPGCCTDNAEMESFFHTLKGDLIKNRVFETEQKLRNSLSGYINSFYNQSRLHSGLGYLSPVQFERMTA